MASQNEQMAHAAAVAKANGWELTEDERFGSKEGIAFYISVSPTPGGDPYAEFDYTSKSRTSTRIYSKLEDFETELLANKHNQCWKVMACRNPAEPGTLHCAKHTGWTCPKCKHKVPDSYITVDTGFHQEVYRQCVDCLTKTLRAEESRLADRLAAYQKSIEVLHSGKRLNVA